LGDIIVENCFLFAVLGFVLKESLKYRFPGKEFPYGALLLSSLLVMCLEGGKVFFVGRSPNAENAILGLLGAFCGVVILPGLFRITVFRKHALKFILGLVVLLAVYEELTPFAWAASFDAIKASAAKIEWVPLASYYHVEPEKALFDVLKKSLIIFPLGFVIATHRASILLSERWWIAPLWGLVIGFILEASQLLQVSHTPSITDILFFGGFSWAGASCFKIYKSIINGEYGSAD
jgi:VanZ family protein